MRINDELNYLLLLKYEDEEVVDLSNYTEEQIKYHEWHLFKDGFLSGADVSSIKGNDVIITGLTSNGHKNLKVLREEKQADEINELIEEGNKLMEYFNRVGGERIITSVADTNGWKAKCRDFLKTNLPSPQNLVYVEELREIEDKNPYPFYEVHLVITVLEKVKPTFLNDKAKGFRDELNLKSSSPVKPDTFLKDPKKEDSYHSRVIINTSKLSKLIAEMLNEHNEFVELCMDLKVDNNDYPESVGMSNNVQKLVLAMKRQNRILELVKRAFAINKYRSIDFIEDCLE